MDLASFLSGAQALPARDGWLSEGWPHNCFEVVVWVCVLFPDYGIVDQVYNWLVNNEWMDPLPEVEGEFHGWGAVHCFHVFLSRSVACIITTL